MTHPLSEPSPFDHDDLWLPGPRRARAQVLSEAAILASSHPIGLVAQRLSITRREVRDRIACGRLLALKRGREIVLPAFQFTLRGLLPGLEAILAARPADVLPTDLINFLNLPIPELALEDNILSPLEWLRLGGEVERVLPLVATLGRDG